MLSKKLALEVINAATSTGADFAEIYYEDTHNKSFTVDNGEVEAINDSTTYGVGLRLLCKFRSVYGYTNDLSKKSLLKLAHDLAASFNEKRSVNEIDSFKKVRVKNIHKVERPTSQVPETEIISFLKETGNIISSYDKRIIRVQTNLLNWTSDVTIYNSDGKCWNTKREYSRLALASVASENGKIETRFDGPGTQAGFEYFTRDLDVKALAKNNAEKVILMLEAKECPSGKFPVIIGNGWGGVIFHEACGHQLEATSVAKGLSVFSGMKGKQIASPIVSAYDDGSISNEWGSGDLDDEGGVPQCNELIKDGILTGYLVDNFNGRRMGEKGNGASRRQSYKFEPTSRMSNTYIAAGKSTPEEIIANTKLALYAVSFGGGSVNPATGDFNFGCNEAYIVKDGKILCPVRGATLVGNAKDILKHIDMVGNDVAFGCGMCGSVSGSLPVNVGQPTIRIDEIVVGGRGGSIDEF